MLTEVAMLYSGEEKKKKRNSGGGICLYRMRRGRFSRPDPQDRTSFIVSTRRLQSPKKEGSYDETCESVENRRRSGSSEGRLREIRHNEHNGKRQDHNE
jgi:hypothetical protein